ncbi:MAG: hypothetical protein ACRDYB_09655 [Acidimicrobiales bacterium]
MSGTSDYQRPGGHLGLLRMTAPAEPLPGLLDEASRANWSHSGLLERPLAVEADAVDPRLLTAHQPCPGLVRFPHDPGVTLTAEPT